jgi:hypothetical protein
MAPEGALKGKVKRFLHTQQGVWFFMPVPSGYGTPSLDFIGCYQGRFFAIETKAPNKLPTARQKSTMEAMQQAGGWAICSDNIEAIVREWDIMFGGL